MRDVISPDSQKLNADTRMIHPKLIYEFPERVNKQNEICENRFSLINMEILLTLIIQHIIRKMQSALIIKLGKRCVIAKRIILLGGHCLRAKIEMTGPNKEQQF
jgi:hypothetical protein